jgi:hypothetical protein
MFNRGGPLTARSTLMATLWHFVGRLDPHRLAIDVNRGIVPSILLTSWTNSIRHNDDSRKAMRAVLNSWLERIKHFVSTSCPQDGDGQPLSTKCYSRTFSVIHNSRIPGSRLIEHFRYCCLQTVNPEVESTRDVKKIDRPAFRNGLKITTGLNQMETQKVSLRSLTLSCHTLQTNVAICRV